MNITGVMRIFRSIFAEVNIGNGSNRAEHTEVFNEKADVGFAAGMPGCGGQLGDGRFALFLPGEYHKPSCRSDRCAHVRKAVVKIEMA